MQQTNLKLESNISLDNDNQPNTLVKKTDYQKISKLKKQGGYTMLEVLVGVAVAAGVAVVLYAAIKPSLDQSSANSFKTDLNVIQSNIRTTYNGQGTGYSTISNDEVIQGEDYLKSWTRQGSKLSSNYGGDITFSSTASGTFTVSYAKVSSGVCKKLIPALTTMDLTEVSVGGSVIWSDAKDVPTKAAVSTACGLFSSVVIAVTSK